MTKLLNTAEDRSEFVCTIMALTDEQLVISGEACLEAVSTLRLKTTIATLHNAPIMFDLIADELIERLQEQARLEQEYDGPDLDSNLLAESGHSDAALPDMPIE